MLIRRLCINCQNVRTCAIEIPQPLLQPNQFYRSSVFFYDILAELYVQLVSFDRNKYCFLKNIICNEKMSFSFICIFFIFYQLSFSNQSRINFRITKVKARQWSHSHTIQGNLVIRVQTKLY